MVQGCAVSVQCIATLELMKVPGANTKCSLYIHYCYGNYWRFMLGVRMYLMCCMTSRSKHFLMMGVSVDGNGWGRMEKPSLGPGWGWYQHQGGVKDCIAQYSPVLDTWSGMLLGPKALWVLFLERDHLMLVGDRDSTWSSGGGILFCSGLLFIFLFFVF